MTAVRTIAIEQFKRFDGTIPRPHTATLSIVFGRISVVDRDRNLLQTRTQDLFCQFIGGIVRLLPKVADLTAKIAAVSHLQIAMDQSTVEEN
jgi:hypothetical protein